ncbi:MAG: Rgg/GadR/MutR family transcriptional regulator [Streptococcus salivarius]|nr:Rgg/GadR/MutR family transcriptional regulator [Streptococcus salivarius]
MKDFGEVFKVIRKSKGVKIIDIADEQISKSQISRFERGESTITLFKLTHMLDKICVTVEEFMYIVRNYKLDNFREQLITIRKYYMDNDIDSLKRLFHFESLDKNSILNRLRAYSIKSILYNITKSQVYKLNQTECDEISNYLFQIDNWGFFEIAILGNTLRNLPVELSFLLTKEILSKKNIYVNIPENKKNIIQLSINTLIICIEKQKYNDSHYLKHAISILLAHDNFFYEKLVFNYAVALLDISENNLSDKKNIENTLLSMKIVDHNLHTIYKQHFDNFINDIKS